MSRGRGRGAGDTSVSRGVHGTRQVHKQGGRGGGSALMVKQISGAARKMCGNSGWWCAAAYLCGAAMHQSGIIWPEDVAEDEATLTLTLKTLRL